MSADATPFDRVRDVLRGEPTLTLADVARQAGLPLQVLRQAFEAMDWADQPAYDERDVAYAAGIAQMLEQYPLETVVRTLRTRQRAMTSLVVSDLATVRDQVVTPALAAGMPVGELTEELGRVAQVLVPLTARSLGEDYRHILLRLLDTEALARGVGSGQELPLAVGFVDVVGFTALSGRVDPAGLDYVISGFEDLVNTAVAAIDGVIVSKFIGDAAMVVGSDVRAVARVLLSLVEDEQRLPDAPRRAGMGAGDVLVRGGDYYGPAINLAARLTDHARPGSLLAGGDLREALSEEFDLTPIRERTIRGIGKHRPLRVSSRG